MTSHDVFVDRRKAKLDIEPTAIRLTTARVLRSPDTTVIPMQSVTTVHHDKRFGRLSNVSIMTASGAVELQTRKADHADQIVAEVLAHLTS
jgi:membrane protein YdbS with pleckstrin-like domain